MLLIEGPPGIGKTSLLAAAREQATAAGMRVLRSRGGELERDFPFALVRQLLEPPIAAADVADRARWLAGAARLAAPLVAAAPATDATPEVTYRLLHALYWLVANLADDLPLALIVDDAHCADAPSARFLSFLAPRLEDLGITVILGARAERSVLAPLLADSQTRILRPRALSADGVAACLAHQLDADPAEAFAVACREATGGNPFLLTELTHEIVAEGITPDASAAARVGSLSPRGISTSVLLRLTGLGPEATALARSVAVLEQASIDVAAAVASLEPPDIERAAERLVQAGVLSPGATLVFAHPVVRSVVYGDLTHAGRADAHSRAARVLAAGETPPDRIAAHVLLAPAGEQWAVGRLRAAAARAEALGSPAVAVAYLERAIAESGPEHHRSELLAELGQASLHAGMSSGIDQLHEAIGCARTPQQVTSAAVALARGLRYAGRAPETVAMLRDATNRVGDAEPQLTIALDAELLAATSASITVRLELADWRARRLIEPIGPPQTSWDHLALASLALDAALDGAPTARTEHLADRALSGIALLGDVRLADHVRSMAGLAYLLVDRFDRSAALFDELIERTAALALAGLHSGMLAQRASLHLRRGRLLEADADASRALELGAEVQGARLMLPRAASVVISVAAARGTAPPAWLLSHQIEPDSLMTRLLAHSRAELLLANGELNAGVAQLLAYGATNLKLGWRGPATEWRSEAGLALNRLGEHERGRTLIEEELEIARRQGAPRAIGVALRAAGLMQRGSPRDALLVEAMETLDGSGADLDLARTLTSLGAERRRRGKQASARELLRRGHELARRCHAIPLSDTAAAELRAAGARPRRPALTGPDSLTPSERRVVDLVAQGMTNREAAQALFLTEKTIETHLRHTYNKLGIRSRRDLAAALTSELSQ